MELKKRVGLQVLFCFSNPEEALDYCIKEGFSALEFNLSSPVFFPENMSANAKRALQNSPIPILLHAPDGLSFFNLHKKPLQSAIERHYEVIDLAYEIGARCVTIHLGSSSHISVNGRIRLIHEIFPEEYESAIRYSIKNLSDYARRKTFLCVENTAGFKYSLSHKVLREFLSKRDLYLTWDIGHTNILKRVDREREEGYMLEFASLIRNCHIHDNSGDWDEHNVIGKGNIYFSHYLPILKKLDAYLIIEVRPKERAVESYKRLKLWL